jgi:hypothetical protein
MYYIQHITAVLGTDVCGGVLWTQINNALIRSGRCAQHAPRIEALGHLDVPTDTTVSRRNSCQKVVLEHAADDRLLETF